MVEYRTVRIPEELVKTVKKIMKKRDNLAYRSHSEFIIDAVRRRVEDLMNSEYDLEKDH
ncbi:MAG: CopG family transcriptional regulator [Candidatus Lokiarchaeota archaeon]|nr:CopG family transcriptional regulator [Candidatus Lokiarchaeota archaeon]